MQSVYTFRPYNDFDTFVEELMLYTKREISFKINCVTEKKSLSTLIIEKITL